jgi:hypothetical protein
VTPLVGDTDEPGTPDSEQLTERPLTPLPLASTNRNVNVQGCPCGTVVHPAVSCAEAGGWGYACTAVAVAIDAPLAMATSVAIRVIVRLMLMA